MKKLIKNYLKDPLSTIAVNTTIFIAGCLFFGTLATIGIVSSWIRDYKNPPTDIRHRHIKQHSDEQVKYDEMIKLLDSINSKLE
jgi:hypothetical protein|tara:strand:+ start:184 stop:435 length:252 start_codon:yes stop_codon:yes gene_type:complete